jgi:hypothetical protein
MTTDTPVKGRSRICYDKFTITAEAEEGSRT